MSDISKIMNSSYDAVSRICKTLFAKTPIDYFEYVRFYDSGDMLLLGTSPDCVINSFANSLLPSLEELNSFHSFGVKVACLSHQMDLPPGGCGINAERYSNNIANAATYNIFHRIYFIERCENYFKIYGYGVSKCSKSIFNFYFNSMSLLEEYVKQFEFQARNLISAEGRKLSINIPYYHQNLSSISDDFPLAVTNNVIIHDCSILTSREKECLSLIARGYTMKNAARKLQISPRTVEQHLRNIKDKYGLNTKNQLVEIWHDGLV